MKLVRVVIQESGRQVNKQYIKEEIPYIYKITKYQPKVECYKLTPESSPEAGVSYLTADEEEKIGPRKLLGHVL